MTTSAHGSSGWIVDVLDWTTETWLTADVSDASRSALWAWLFKLQDGLPDDAELVYPNSRDRYYAIDYLKARCSTPDGTVEVRFFVFSAQRTIRVTQLIMEPSRGR